MTSGEVIEHNQSFTVITTSCMKIPIGGFILVFL